MHGGWVPLNSALSKIFIKKDIKFVLTPHGAYNKHAMLRNAWIKKIYFHWFEKPLLEAAYKIHSIGASEVDGLNSIYPNAPTLLLPYGFDMSLVKNNMHVSQTFTIGYMGRLDTHTKGLDLLIQAFDIFHKGYKNSRLWIIGDGTGAPYLHKYIKNKNLNSVVMWGKKFGEEKEALMRQLHVFAHPSRNEGLPNAVLEAAALGIPSIVSKATNVDKYITEFKAGIAIEDNSLCALVNAFQEMYSSFENGQMSYYHDGPRKMLKQIFDWPILVEKYMALYH